MGKSLSSCPKMQESSQVKDEAIIRYFREPVSGFTHLIGTVLALTGLIWLLIVTYPDTSRILVSLVYGFSVILTFTASTLMHLYNGRNPNAE